MHEMALTAGVVKVLEEQARAQSYTVVKTVWLEIGALSTVDPEAMRFCFQAVAKGTVAEGAVVEITRTPGTAWCMPCAASVAIAELYDCCPNCGSPEVTVTGGTEMRITELEVE